MLFATPPTSTYEEVQQENISRYYLPHRAVDVFLLTFLTELTACKFLE